MNAKKCNHIEQAVQKELRLFKAIVESSSEAIAVSDPAGELVYINRAHENLFGRSLHEARRMNYRDYYPPESVKILEEEVAPALARGESWEGELDVYDAAGRRFALWERADTVRSPDGTMLYGFGFMHDVSERRAAEVLLSERTRALRERVKELHCLYGISKLVGEPGSTLEGILQGVVELIPPALQYPEMTWARIELKNRQYRSDNYAQTRLKLAREIRVGGDPFGTLEVGCIQEQQSSADAFFLEEEQMLISTIAERLGHIIAHEQARKNIQALTRALIDAQENERRMISSELHDRVAQDLSAAKISCDMMMDHCAQLPELFAAGLQELSRSLERTIMAVRDLSYEMRPPGLEEMGLVRVVENFCRDFSEKTGIPAEFQSAGLTHARLPATVAISLYRLIQEGLNNVHKHARASRVSVRLVRVHPHIIVRIEDDGCGFDIQEVLSRAAPEKRMGLVSMQQRAGILNGDLDIRSEHEKGTKIWLRIPAEETQDDG
jgi:PAS domain S-box-containing protein